MLLRQHQTILLGATTVLLLAFGPLLKASTQARTVDVVVSPEKSETITFIHDDDSIDMYRSHDVEDDDGGKGLENDEDNEVISVRLLNSFQLKPYGDGDHQNDEENEEEVQNVSYENMLEPEEQVVTFKNDMISLLQETSTVSTSTSPSSPATSPSSSTSSTTTTVETSLEDDWVRSRVEIPESVETTTIGIKPVIMPTKVSTKMASTTSQTFSSTSTAKLDVVTPHPKVFGTRKRTARNNNDYYQYPSIDMDQLDFEDLDYSDVDEIRLKELLSTRFIPASAEQSNRKDCHCTTQEPQPASSNAEYYDDYPEEDFPVATPQPRTQPHQGRFARRKRLHRQLAYDDYDYEVPNDPLTTASNGDASMERAERMHGTLERIMGIVTIMSHVDNFIQKKTKQSIRRLARLYESSEK